MKAQRVLRLPTRRATLHGLRTFTPDDEAVLMRPSNLLRPGSLCYVIQCERDGDYHYRLAVLRMLARDGIRRTAKVEYTDTGDVATVDFFRLRVVLIGL